LGSSETQYIAAFGVVGTNDDGGVPFERQDVLGQEAVAALAVGFHTVAATLLELILGGLEGAHKVQPVIERLEAGLVPAVRCRGPRHLDESAGMGVVAHDDVVALGGDVADARGGRTSAACVNADADVVNARGVAEEGVEAGGGVVGARGVAAKGAGPRGGVAAARGVAAEGAGPRGGVAAARGVAAKGVGPRGCVVNARGVA